ncbi:MAG: helix-turn-helix domain-containing protein [Dysosmobacter sp.]
MRGDPEAVNQVLDHYSGYIAALSMRRGYDQNGNPCLAVTRRSAAGSRRS